MKIRKLITVQIFVWQPIYTTQQAYCTEETHSSSSMYIKSFHLYSKYVIWKTTEENKMLDCRHSDNS